jgi:cytidyltransferase-like protein
MRTAVFIGRFQPFHDGHRACIQHILTENDACVVLVRDTAKDERNPYSLAERYAMIRAAFPDESRVLLQSIPDPGCDLTVYRGRDVGWALEDIKLDPATEAISATSIRDRSHE